MTQTILFYDKNKHCKSKILESYPEHKSHVVKSKAKCLKGNGVFTQAKSQIVFVCCSKCAYLHPIYKKKNPFPPYLGDETFI